MLLCHVLVADQRIIVQHEYIDVALFGFQISEISIYLVGLYGKAES